MRTQSRDLRRQRLVEHAKAEFAHKGFHETNISEIVRQAGVARSTFYQYFDSKLHLFQSIFDSFLQDLHDAVQPISLAPGASAPLVQIQDNLTRVLDMVLKEKELTQMLLHQASPLDRTVEKRLTDFYSQVAQMIERSIMLGISMRLVRPCNARLTAYSIIGAVKEVIFQITSAEETRPIGVGDPPVAELVRELLEFGMGGILVKPRESLMETGSSAR